MFKLFEHWTDEIQVTCKLVTGIKIPSVHLNREVSKHPTFKPDFHVDLLE